MIATESPSHAKIELWYRSCDVVFLQSLFGQPIFVQTVEQVLHDENGNVVLGFQFPNLFYGQVRRQRQSGSRADFCEFCMVVCRHHVISNETASAIFFFPLQFEEVSRESRCEVCGAQFPLSTNTECEKQNAAGTSLPDIHRLIQSTNPAIVKKASAEVAEMVNRVENHDKLRQLQFASFCRYQEEEYKKRTRSFYPFLATGSIQAVILSAILLPWVSLPIAAMLAGSLFLFVVLIALLRMRQKNYRWLSQRLSRFLNVTKIKNENAMKSLEQSYRKYPNVAPFFFKRLSSNTSRQTLTPDIDYIELDGHSSQKG